MKKTIKKFALLPIEVETNGLSYYIWLTHYYEEWELVNVGGWKELPTQNENGSCGYVYPSFQWVLINVYQ